MMLKLYAIGTGADDEYHPASQRYGLPNGGFKFNGRRQAR
jgi:hypothetical protein